VHIFIDESGSFTGFHPGSLSIVGGLAIPSCKIPLLEKRYASLRRNLPLHRGEVKGRYLNEYQVASVVDLLARSDAVFEATVVDLGIHSEAAVTGYRNALVDLMTLRLPMFREDARSEVAKAVLELSITPLNLFIQAIASFELLRNLIENVPLFFAQRRPQELGEFRWVVDGKDAIKATAWELWWTLYARGALAAMSKNRPGIVLEGADYSYFDRFKAISDDGVECTDLSLLLADFQFSANPMTGLELVDVLTNAMRRALVGNLKFKGWRNLPKLMIHRNQHYPILLRLDGASIAPRAASYSQVMKHFSQGGRSMFTQAMLDKADED
jgi:hypothetical protein